MTEGQKDISIEKESAKICNFRDFSNFPTASGHVRFLGRIYTGSFHWPLHRFFRPIAHFQSPVYGRSVTQFALFWPLCPPGNTFPFFTSQLGISEQRECHTCAKKN